MPTVVELKKQAKAAGIRGYSKMRKAELEDALKKARPVPAPRPARPVPAPRPARPVPAPRPARTLKSKPKAKLKAKSVVKIDDDVGPGRMLKDSRQEELDKIEKPVLGRRYNAEDMIDAIMTNGAFALKMEVDVFNRLLKKANAFKRKNRGVKSQPRIDARIDMIKKNINTLQKFIKMSSGLGTESLRVGGPIDPPKGKKLVAGKNNEILIT